MQEGFCKFIICFLFLFFIGTPTSQTLFFVHKLSFVIVIGMLWLTELVFLFLSVTSITTPTTQAVNATSPITPPTTSKGFGESGC